MNCGGRRTRRSLWRWRRQATSWSSRLVVFMHIRRRTPDDRLRFGTGAQARLARHRLRSGRICSGSGWTSGSRRGPGRPTGRRIRRSRWIRGAMLLSLGSLLLVVELLEGLPVLLDLFVCVRSGAHALCQVKDHSEDSEDACRDGTYVLWICVHPQRAAGCYA